MISLSFAQTDIVEVEAKPTADMTEAETEALMDAVRKQVEYYFSKENLQSDAYLTSHMDANMTVAIATVMKVLTFFSFSFLEVVSNHGFISDVLIDGYGDVSRRYLSSHNYFWAPAQKYQS